MNNKTFWMGFAAVFIVAQIIGFMVHQVMLADTYEKLAQIFRPEAEMMDMMAWFWVSGALSLFFFCYIFTKGHEGTGIMEGVRYGALMGLFFSIPMAIDQFVTYPLPGDLAIIWLVTGVVSFIIVGAVFAAIYKPSVS